MNRRSNLVLPSALTSVMASTDISSYYLLPTCHRHPPWPHLLIKVLQELTKWYPTVLEIHNFDALELATGCQLSRLVQLFINVESILQRHSYYRLLALQPPPLVLATQQIISAA